MFYKTRQIVKQICTNVGAVLLTALGDEDTVDEYRVRQLIEEAISSSIVEGARPTTREQARAMVREQREPASRDERMILNNWRAMRRILELHQEGRDLTLGDLLELHRILGEDALDTPGAEGKLRCEADAVDVADLERRAKRLRNLEKTVADFDELNHRQRTLLQHTVRHPRASYTINGHAASHRVHYQTARTDLIDLVERGFFEEKRVGKGKRFFASPKFAKRVRRR